MVLSVQYLRGLAAFMVLLEHVGLKSSQYSGNVLSSWHVGGAGVDLFFVISGFIMVYVVWDRPRGIKAAGENKMVVGSQARILYADREGRIKIAQAFNKAIKEGKIGPVVLGRDHHDVSGTDSPYRETSNIYDGSSFTADMAVQNFVGDGFRGATWISLHNGGGVGWGEVINGGFGMLLDGSEAAERRLKSMLLFDVNNGIARRSWARNEEANFAIKREMARTPKLKVTLSNNVDDEVLSNLDF